MLMSYGKGSHGDPQASAGMFCLAVDELPAWCVKAAVKDWACGDGDLDTRFPPRPAEIRRMAWKHFGVVAGERDRLLKLKKAKPRRQFSEDHQARMRAHVERVIAKVRGG